MLNVAKITYPHIEFIESDLTKEDTIIDQKFNLITTFRFYRNAEHTLRDEAFKIIISHLSKDGFLIFNNHDSSDGIIQRLRKLMGYKIVGQTRKDCRKFAHYHGLKIIQEYHVGIMPFSDTRIIKPIFLAKFLELILRNIPGFSFLAQNTIFVCKRI